MRSQKHLTVQKVASMIAGYFNDLVKEDDFENFEDMKKCYDWTSADIKTEVESCLRDWVSDDHEYISYYDDCSVSDESGEYSYRQFRNMIFKEVH